MYDCHTQVVTYQVSRGGFTIFDGGKSTQSILVDVNSQWVTRGDQYVDAKIKLERIYEKGLCVCVFVTHSHFTHEVF